MLRTAESCTPSHPDKLCDIISDSILDEALRQDPYARVAIETMGGHGIVTITGELTMNGYVDVKKIATNVLNDKYGVQVNIVSQSPDIAKGVDTGGAGDPVTTGAYTAGFEGKHFIKCNDCGNTITKEYYIDMNGAFDCPHCN